MYFRELWNVMKARFFISNLNSETKAELERKLSQKDEEIEPFRYLRLF